jgi:hypothetical protein
LLDAQQHAEVARVDEFVGVDALQGVDRAPIEAPAKKLSSSAGSSVPPTKSSKVVAALTA